MSQLPSSRTKYSSTTDSGGHELLRSDSCRTSFDYSSTLEAPPPPTSFHTCVSHSDQFATEASANRTSPPSKFPKPAYGTSPAMRPPITRAATATAAPAPPSSSSATPLLSRPMLQRAAATTTALPYTSSNNPTRTSKPGNPSLMRRATDLLDLNGTTSYTARNAPRKPSHWTDHAHRDALARIWDHVHSAAANSKYHISTTAQVASTEKRMLERYSELAEGDTPMSRAWVEYVLGICLRHPFCTAEKMGRYEVLAAGAGARGNWGPW